MVFQHHNKNRGDTFFRNGQWQQGYLLHRYVKI